VCCSCRLGHINTLNRRISIMSSSRPHPLQGRDQQEAGANHTASLSADEVAPRGAAVVDDVVLPLDGAALNTGSSVSRTEVRREEQGNGDDSKRGSTDGSVNDDNDNGGGGNGAADGDEGCSGDRFCYTVFCCCCCQDAVRNRCRKVLLSWPRTFAILLGVVVPLFGLIFLSAFFGLLLAYAEAPHEVASNNEALAAQFSQLVNAFILADLASIVPPLCYAYVFRFGGVSFVSSIAGSLFFHNSHRSLSYRMFLVDKPVDQIDLVIQQVLFSGVDRDDPLAVVGHLNLTREEVNTLFTPGIDTTLNTAELNTWMVECGKEAEMIVNKTITSGDGAVFNVDLGSSLTFNWIRSVPGARGLGKLRLTSRQSITYESMKPESQQDHFKRTWEGQRQLLQKRYYNEIMATTNISSAEAKREALQWSVQEATGESGKCTSLSFRYSRALVRSSTEQHV